MERIVTLLSVKAIPAGATRFTPACRRRESSNNGTIGAARESSWHSCKHQDSYRAANLCQKSIRRDTRISRQFSYAKLKTINSALKRKIRFDNLHYKILIKSPAAVKVATNKASSFFSVNLYSPSEETAASEIW